ncbi:MAG: 6-hydroxynicotinate 3-monooxygenase [Alphaproteobacteria bacterium]|nr:6-hydroxynicotinate 3-monooxygenase [Alphaproteobacteria bacterium]
MVDATPAIAIVGAGIAGLTAAATLRRIGLKVDIYEQAPAFAWIGAGLQLNPNAMKVMRGLGLEAHIRSVGFAPEVGYNREWNTGEITYLHPMGDKIEQRFGAPDISLHRAELHAALLLINPAEIIHLGKKLAGLDQAGSGVRLTFTDGTWVEADAVVGADGVHSAVLEILFGSGEPRFTGQVAYRATYRSELLGTKIDDRVKWWGPGRHIVTYKVNPRRDELYFIASTPEPDFKIESWSARGDLDQMRAAFTGFHPQARVILDACPEVRKWALVERDPLVRWSEGRIVLIGDACHPMLPYMAQGGSAAIEDAVVLARCLEGTDLDGFSDAFRRFERNRKDRTSRIQLGARKNTWMRTAPDMTWLYDYDAWTVPLD